MFTTKAVLAGLLSVATLYVAMWVIKGFSQVSSTRTSGPAVLLSNLVSVLINPAFWVLAAIAFFAAVFVIGKSPAWRNP